MKCVRLSLLYKKFLFSITRSIHYYVHIITRFQIFEKGKNAYFIVSSYFFRKNMPSQLMPEHQNPFVPSVPVQNASIRAEFQYPLCEPETAWMQPIPVYHPTHIGTIDKPLVCDFILIAELPQNSDCLCIRSHKTGNMPL